LLGVHFGDMQSNLGFFQGEIYPLETATGEVNCGGGEKSP
tara:strand:- start:459 stop:578 length:120 start_codon:yes stop_codon:yes gene_type:complete